ncbi:MULTISPECIES: dienelactone hydrolase family protein [unclassified Sphingobium]|uniref:carboxylesterase family protein n=1 Tax=unclassified Sphingobium TaxID=2611147 RepID=UPI002225860D|nr:MULTISPECIES: dienelactone hydrolase family protein [unclassified Sphingobium]MCW2394075.1 putative peptidase [Sphingobium sp. B8D3B]MCW2417589.1 putative peptidase [Sphingobium sp. B8D3C]
MMPPFHRPDAKLAARFSGGKALFALGALGLLLAGCNGAASDAQNNAAAANASTVQTGDLKLTYAMPQAKGEEIAYRVFLPSNWRADRHWPMVLILHGYGNTADGPFDDAGGALQREAEKHGFVVVSPNGYNGMADYGANLPLPSALPDMGKKATMTPEQQSALAEADVRNVLAKAMADYNIDPRRVYLMGNSMGMTGVLHFAQTDPQLWCAISASGGPPWPDYPVEQLKPISSVLLVHGGKDDRANASDTQTLTERLKAAGIDARMELIPEGTHGDAWVRYLPQTLDFFATHDCASEGRANG